MHLVTAIGLARSWQESDVVPHHATLREVIAGLRTFIHRLLPEAELHGAGLPADSDEFRAVCQFIANARTLAAANVPADPAQAVEHAKELGELAGVFQGLAEKAVDQILMFGDTRTGPR